MPTSIGVRRACDEAAIRGYVYEFRLSSPCRLKKLEGKPLRRRVHGGSVDYSTSAVTPAAKNAADHTSSSTYTSHSTVYVPTYTYISIQSTLGIMGRVSYDDSRKFN